MPSNSEGPSAVGEGLLVEHDPPATEVGPESAECGSRDGHHEGGVGRAEPLEIDHKVAGFGQEGRNLSQTGPYRRPFHELYDQDCQPPDTLSTTRSIKLFS